MFSNVDSTLTEIRSTMSEDKLEAVVLMQTHRKRVTELAVNDIDNNNNNNKNECHSNIIVDKLQGCRMRVT